MEKTVRKTRKSASQRRALLRDALWPGVLESDLWLRTQRVGFTTIPRTLTLVGRIMDQLSGKGCPLSSTYLALWCWVFDEAFVEIRNPKELAYESGFNGARGETTWRTRMRRLEELGFIRVKQGLLGEYQYVLLMNPIKVIERHFSEKPKDQAYTALLGRLAQVGADDLDV